MNKKIIVFIVFLVSLVFLLTSTSIFNPQGTTSLTLNVTTANTTIIVKDNLGNVISNDKGIIKLGEDYTITIQPNSTYELKSLKLNGVSIVNDIVNSAYTFTCTGHTTIFAVSVLAGSNGEVVAPDLDENQNPINYVSLNYYSCEPFIFYPSGATVDLMVYDQHYNLLDVLELGQSYNFLVCGNTYIFDYVITNGSGYASINLFNSSNVLVAGGEEGKTLKYTTSNENVFAKVYYNYSA